MESGSSLTFVTPTEEGLLEQVQQNLQKEAGKAEEVKEGRGRGGGRGKEGRGKGEVGRKKYTVDTTLM